MPSVLPAPNALAALAAKYRLGPINQKQQRCLRLQAKLWELKNDAGQTDYTSAHVQLAQDAATATMGLMQADLPAVAAGNAWQIAAAISGAPNTLNAQILSLGRQVNRPDDLLERMELLVEYLLQQATGD